MKNEILRLLQLEDNVSKDTLKRIVAAITKNSEIVRDLVPLLSIENSRLLQKTGLVLSEVAIHTPEIFLPHTSSMLNCLYKNPKDATKRNTLRILQHVNLPAEQYDAAVDLCFQYLMNKNEPVAIQVFAMSILAKIVTNYPELKNELILILEDRIPTGSSGFKSRAKKTLRELE